MLRTITILLAITGFAIGVYAVATQEQPQPVPPLARPAAINPFASGVAALGIVEPATRNLQVVAPEAGLVTKVLVSVGDRVNAGDPLFMLDTRTLEADLIRAEADVLAAQAAIDRWHALPRKEDLPPLEAGVAAAQAVLNDRTDQLRVTEDAVRRQASTERDLAIARFSRDNAVAELDRAKAALASAQAGGWQPDLAINQAQLAQTQARVRSLKLLVDRLTVRAPQQGVVLRRNIEPGEFANTAAAAGSQPALILGDLSNLAIRAQIDEEDIALIADASGQALPNLKALARTRGAQPTMLELQVLRIEPFARPKSDLAGNNTERVDTRVIDVVLRVTSQATTPIFPGQAVDVFIGKADNQ
jgi:multidrug efflux pump subunit AcrA (membrane-fusion protein)